MNSQRPLAVRDVEVPEASDDCFHAVVRDTPQDEARRDKDRSRARADPARKLVHRLENPVSPPCASSGSTSTPYMIEASEGMKAQTIPQTRVDPRNRLVPRHDHPPAAGLRSSAKRGSSRQTFAASRPCDREPIGSMMRSSRGAARRPSADGEGLPAPPSRPSGRVGSRPLVRRRRGPAGRAGDRLAGRGDGGAIRTVQHRQGKQTGQTDRANRQGNRNNTRETES